MPPTTLARPEPDTRTGSTPAPDLPTRCFMAPDLATELAPPRLAARFVRAAVLATGLAIGLGFSVPALPGVGHLQPAYPVPLTVVPRRVLPSDPAVDLRRAAAVAAAAAGHRCVAVDAWPAGDIPLGAVMTPHLDGRAATTARWYPFDDAWALAEQGRADTVLLCAG